MISEQRPPNEPRTLAVDIGGTGIKSIVLDMAGDPVSERVKLPTPRPATPDPVLETIAALAASQPPYDRVSIGFPGVVRAGVTLTAPNLDPAWRYIRLAERVSDLLGRPARAANDADIQGFGAIAGEGVELVLTLGTGLGSALFIDGILVPNLELGHHPFRRDLTYEQHLGNAALKTQGDAAWLNALGDAVDLLRKTFSYDRLLLGGGNARLLEKAAFPEDVVVIPNIAGLLGGIALWNDVDGTTLARAPHALGAHSVFPPKAGRSLAGPTSTCQETIDRLRAASPAILPSLLLCDFSRLADEIARLEAAGAQVLHLDVMDGHFTHNFTYGLTIVEATRKCTSLPLDAHLMITEPGRYVQAFRKAGADVITIHVEADSNPRSTLEKVRESGAAAGLALNPATPLDAIEPLIDACDLVLVMSVPAGFGGQPFDERAIEKLKRLREITGGRCLLEADGGLHEATIRRTAEAGAELFVVGSAIFKHADYGERIKSLTDSAR